MSPARTVLRLARAAGIELRLHDGKLVFSAPVGAMTPALKGGLLEHRAEIIDLYQPREARIAAVATVVRLYEGYWPLTLATLCRALVASRHPLRTMPVSEFLDRLDGVTPEYEEAVHATALRALRAGAIPQKSVALP